MTVLATSTLRGLGKISPGATDGPFMMNETLRLIGVLPEWPLASPPWSETTITSQSSLATSGRDWMAASIWPIWASFTATSAR